MLAAADDANPTVKQAHTCEANFYGGQYALIEGQRDDAVKLFEAAAKDCPHGFLEGIAATAELKGLGREGLGRTRYRRRREVLDALRRCVRISSAMRWRWHCAASRSKQSRHTRRPDSRVP